MNALTTWTLWSVSVVALLLASAVGWKVFLEPKTAPVVPGVVDKEVQTPWADSAAVARTSDAKPPIPKSTPTAATPTNTAAPVRPVPFAADAKPSATVRLPVSPAVTDKTKLEEEAFAVANALTAKRPSDPKAIHVAAVCNSQLNRTGEAQRLWEKCVELQPKTETYYLNLAANALFRGDTEYALEVTEKAQANGLKSSDISHHQALALARLGEDERAVIVLREAIGSNTASPGHWMLLGQSLLRLGKLEEAKQNLEQAVKLGVSNRALYSALMNTCVRLKLPEEAAKYREQVDAMGDDATTDGNQRFAAISDREARRVLIAVLGEASSVYREASLFEDAESLGLRLLVIDPSNYGICRFLADLYRDTKRKTDEIVVRERMLQLAPKDVMNLLQLARCYADTNQPEQTQAILKLAIATAPDEAIGYAAIAEFLVERRDAAKAKWFAEQAINREASPAGFKLLAAILRSLGKEAEAQKVEANATTSQSTQ